MAMLITAARSLITPQSAARAIGVALIKLVPSIPTKLNELSWVAQTRKDKIKQKTAMLTSQPVARVPRISSHAAN